MSILRFMLNYRSTLIFILTPILLLPLPLVFQNTESSCAYCIILMAVYWISEVLPLPVTSFLPLILFPVLGIMPAKDVSVTYMKDTLWLILGGLIIAVAVEDTGFHKRIAAGVLRVVGTKPHSLLFGFMLPTFFLSMWVNNTAATAMMIPMVEAVLLELDFIAKPEPELQAKETDNKNSNAEHYVITNFCARYPATDLVEAVPNSSETTEEISSEEKEENSIAIIEEEDTMETFSDKVNKALTICVPYSSSIGGISTLTGTGSNVVLAGQYPILFPDTDKPLTYGLWLAFSFPLACLLLILMYFWFVWLYLGARKTMRDIFSKRETSNRDIRIKAILQDQYDRLGTISWDEVTVAIVLAITVLLWFFREPGFMPGWSVLFLDGYVSDGTVAMTMATSLFILPSKCPAFLVRNSYLPGYTEPMKPVKPILDWKTVGRMVPWDVVFLIGGGFALAEGSVQSGFSEWLGNKLSVLDGIPDWAICLTITVVICLFTEFTGNVATASLFIPIIAQLAQVTKIHPLYLLVPATLATSLAFMLPVATAPNAIAFSFGRIKVKDMIKAGWFVNILGIFVVMLAINTYGMVLFDLSEFPEWAYPDNTTGSN